jgi:pimeloyl-ACP methyl ester carboxylesterase
LKRRKIGGSGKIGLWGISRAGYVCPLVIQEYASIAFWISVSGPDSLDSSPYRIESAIRNINYKRDEKTKAVIIVPDFKEILNSIKCPVLSINGEKDYVVDWRKTLALYKEAIGKNNNKKLTIKTFPDGNHGMRKCKTGALNEVIDKEEFCDGYIEIMTTWLKENGFGK